MYWGADRNNKLLVMRMLLRSSGVRDCSAVLGLSIGCVLRIVLSMADKLEIKPKHSYYCKVQIDEQWSYVGNKSRKVWLIYAYCHQTGEILGFAMGKRNSKTVRQLVLKLKRLEIDFYLTDDWKAFKATLPYHKHLIGKQFTKAIEGVNTWFRTRIKRLVRRTTAFSKKLIYHYAIIKTAIYHRNLHSPYI